MKTIDIDWDNYEAVSKLAQQCKSRALQLKPNRITTADFQKEIFLACIDILNTDISHLYNNDNLINTYYVYCHCDTSKPLIKTKRNGKVAFAASLGLNFMPFYIGKGTGNRAYDLNRNDTHRKIRQRLKLTGKEIEVNIIKSGITSDQALALESKLIDIFGVLGKGGKLVNLDEGKASHDRRLLYAKQLKLLHPLHEF